MTENPTMQTQIVEAALRRFAHFGISKTTLTEVAEDMAITKQALSYYYQDKQSLVNATVEKLTREYGEQLKSEMEASATVKEALLKLTEVKSVFFEKYYMLLTQAEHMEIVKHKAFHNWKEYLVGKESGLVTQLFEKGVRSGELRPIDTQKTAELLLETLRAISSCVREKGALPVEKDFREALFRQQELIRIFYQGIMAETNAKLKN